MHRLATIHNVIDDNDSRTQQCTNSVTVRTVGYKLHVLVNRNQ